MAYFQDMIRFNEAIDEALAESTAAYAEQVNRSRDIFLAILGHDLRAPLQAVSMSTELLLRKTALEGDALACVTHIQRGTRHMTVMVSDLLELVRSRLGRSLPIEPAPMDMAEAAHAAIAEACAGNPESDPTLEVLGDVRGNWDPGRIAQLLQNLIGNALQHGFGQARRDGDPQGRAGRHSSNGAQPRIADLRRRHRHIFDPLVRSAGRTTGSASTSLGLGLFIVKEVSTLTRGRLEVSSNERTARGYGGIAQKALKPLRPVGFCADYSTTNRPNRCRNIRFSALTISSDSSRFFAVRVQLGVRIQPLRQTSHDRLGKQ